MSGRGGSGGRAMGFRLERYEVLWMTGSEGQVVGDGAEGPLGSTAQRLFSRRLVLIGGTNLITSMSAIIVLPLLTKNLSASDYGIWVLVLATVTLAPLVIDLGLPGAMVRFLAAERRKREVQEGFYSVFLVVLCTGGAVSATIFLLAPWIATGSMSGHEDVIRLMAAVVLVDCLNSVLFNYFRTFQRIKRYSGFIAFQTTLFVVLLAAALVSDMGLRGAVISLLVSRTITVLVMLGLVVRELGLRWPRFTRVREVLRYGVPLVPADLSGWAVGSADRYVIGIVLGTAFVGYYAPGYALSAIILMLVSPLRFLMPATLADLYDRNLRDRVRAYLRAALKYFLLLAIPASVGLGLLSRDLLEVLTTDEIAREGYMVTPLVAVAMVFYGTQIILAQVLLVEKETRKIGGVMSVAAVLNLVLNLLLIPVVGIVGAAMATLVSFAISMLITGSLSFRYIRVEVDRGALAKTVAASAAMGTAIWALGLADLPGGLLGIVLVVLAGFAVFSGTTLLLGTLSRGELRFFWGLLRGGADGHRG